MKSYYLFYQFISPLSGSKFQIELQTASAWDAAKLKRSFLGKAVVILRVSACSSVWGGETTYRREFFPETGAFFTGQLCNVSPMGRGCMGATEEQLFWPQNWARSGICI